MLKLHLKTLLFCFFLGIGFQFPTWAVKKALIIGIDQYNPKNATGTSEWMNLEGAVNDAQAIREILKAKFGFSNITFLGKPEETTREGILNAMEKLVKDAQKDDVIFFYYAGHGTQVYNSLIDWELDKMHEGIVPADAYKGAQPILDVELNTVFNKILDKGAQLTIIFDSCHSGSATRSKFNPDELRSRFVPPSGEDIKKQFTKPVNLTEKGALVFSAAQDFETAKEKAGEGTKHGAFTYSLLNALQTSSANESAMNIFKKAHSVLLYNAIPSQNPVIEGKDERKLQTLFGDVSASGGKTVVGVFNLESPERVMLEGGLAVGLREGSTLYKLNGKDTIRVEVTESKELTRCVAKVIAGDHTKLAVGDLMILEGFCNGTEANLKVWLSASLKDEQLGASIQATETFIAANGVSLVQDPTRTVSTHSLSYNGTQWVLSSVCGKQETLNTLTDKDLKSAWTKVSEGCEKAKGNKLYFNIPPTENFRSKLEAKLKEANARFVTPNSTEAHYLLTGWKDKTKGLTYAWVLNDPNAAEATQPHPLPLSTDFIPSTEGERAVMNLTEKAQKLGKIRGWLTLESPPNDASFPYKLALKQYQGSKMLSEGAIVEGETYGLVLTKDKTLFQSWNREDRFIYVFTIDADGAMTLLYPLNANVENNITRIGLFEGEYSDVVKLSYEDLFDVEPPFGTDNYFLLTTSKPIYDLSIFKSEGVRTTRSKASDDPLMQLLEDTSAGQQRGPKVRTRPNWSIQKASIKSVPKS
jgi:uncharacterized caspase-like protein